jgi:hypothetical protein
LAAKKPELVLPTAGSRIVQLAGADARTHGLQFRSVVASSAAIGNDPVGLRALPRPRRCRRRSARPRAGTRWPASRWADAGRPVNPANLPRPSDPPSCPAALRKHLWVWLDRVAAWINHECQRRPDTVIPSCWPAHPHIAHELAVIASLRHNARLAFQPDPVEEWHRYALPGFLAWIRLSGCRRVDDVEVPSGSGGSGLSTS